MPKAASSIASLPSSAQTSLEILGEHLRLGRKRRKESLRSWSLRLNVSVPTLVAMEKGDARVGIGVYATALWLMGRDVALRELAAPENDAQALAHEIAVIQSKVYACAPVPPCPFASSPGGGATGKGVVVAEFILVRYRDRSALPNWQGLVFAAHTGHRDRRLVYW